MELVVIRVSNECCRSIWQRVHGVTGLISARTGTLSDWKTKTNRDTIQG
jgi:hypothetical protein